MTREDAIREVRRKMRAGEFDRSIVRITPDDVIWDECTLECGHTTQNGEDLKSADPPLPPTRAICRRCAEAWVKVQTEELREANAK